MRVHGAARPATARKPPAPLRPRGERPPQLGAAPDRSRRRSESASMGDVQASCTSQCSYRERASAAPPRVTPPDKRHRADRPPEWLPDTTPPSGRSYPRRVVEWQCAADGRRTARATCPRRSLATLSCVEHGGNRGLSPQWAASSRAYALLATRCAQRAHLAARESTRRTMPRIRRCPRRSTWQKYSISVI